MKKLSYSTYIEKGFGYIVDIKMQTFSVDLHNHDFFEIEFILAARGAYHILNGKKRLITKGSTYIINPSDIHSYEVEPGGYFKRYNVRFKQDTVSGNILATVINTHCRCVLEGGDFDMARKMYEIIEDCYKNELGGTSSDIGSRIIESIILLIRDRSRAEFGEEAIKKTQIQSVLLYLHKNFKNPITLEDIAAYSNFSPHYVCQMFHSETSYTITQYLTNLRLEYAKNLLFATDHSISEICTKCGFHSFAHFLRCFKSAYGTSPSGYRKIKRSEAKI